VQIGREIALPRSGPHLVHVDYTRIKCGPDLDRYYVAVRGYIGAVTRMGVRFGGGECNRGQLVRAVQVNLTPLILRHS